MEKYSEDYNRFFRKVNHVSNIVSEILDETKTFDFLTKYQLKNYIIHLNMINIELIQLLKAYDDPLQLEIFFTESEVD